ncbi:MAG: metallophosphoesterase, partial [Planctomycetota bacterium]
MAESFTVAHASDPHLGHRREADAAENARVVAEAIAADAEVGLVVVAGDLTDDGDRSPEDFGLAQAWLASLGKPWRVAPGNHDVGAFTAVGEGVVTEEACRRFADAFGPASGGDRWADHEAAPGWSLLGVNAMVAGSGLAREKEQQRWLVAQRRVAHQRGHVVGLVTHAPLFVNEP